MTAPAASSVSATRSLREPGAILLVSCYELGHQPLGIAWPQAFLERAGYAPDSLDLAIEPWDEARIRRAQLVGIAVPMHTALRLGARAAERIRHANPDCHIVFSDCTPPSTRSYWPLAERDLCFAGNSR